MQIAKYMHLVGAAGLLLVAALARGADPSAADGKPYGDLPIQVVNPVRLRPGSIPAMRIPLGIPDDYKPWIVPLKNGELMIVAYHTIRGEKHSDQGVIWRSKDGGRTWGPREDRKDLLGSEFTVSCLSDGTLLMVAWFYIKDMNYRSGIPYSHTILYRSTDNGGTWSATPLLADNLPKDASTLTDRVATEMPDPTNPKKKMVMLGVSVSSAGKAGPSFVRLWRSWDSGRTWDKSLKPDTQGWDDVDGFFAESGDYRSRSGKMMHVIRVDRTGPYWWIPGTPEKLKDEHGDNGDRMMLWESTDNGLTWRKHNGNGNFGTYGEMFPRFLRLKDGRVLLTFTDRSNPADGYGLGLRAILSDDDGETWDFTQDRLVISYVNEGWSGGGFGNTVQLKDGALVSVYSFRGTDKQTHVEAVRWALPTK